MAPTMVMATEGSRANSSFRMLWGTASSRVSSAASAEAG